VRNSRRRRRSPAGDTASCRWACAWRARHRGARRTRAATDDGKRRHGARRHRLSRCARRLPRCRQNRDSVDRRCGRILVGPVQGVVRRRRARESPAPRGYRRDRRAGRQARLRRRRGGAGFCQRDGRRAAFARRAAGWPRPRAGDDARAGESCAMRSAALPGRTTMQTRSDNKRAKDLRTLLAGSAVTVPADIGIVDLTLDSRAVQFGGAFIALPGTRTHGIGFAAQAVNAGARAILWEPTPGVAAPRVPDSVLLLAVPNLTAILGTIADRFFGTPSQAVRTVGVTGTNGKTTTAYVIATATQLLGTPAAYAGTIGFGRIDALQAVTHTTPDSITVHRQLDELRAEGVRSLAMEVSSHALDQHRVDGVRFDTAVFTNLTRDHLDYHGTFESYAAAKAKLFVWPELKHAVINADDAFGRALL